MGILAKKENKEKKKKIDIYKAKGKSSAPKDLFFIREPNKNPIFLEKYNKTLKDHLKYLYTILQFKRKFNKKLNNEKVLIRIKNIHIKKGLNIQFIKSSLILKVLVESSNIKLNISFINFIIRNMDFI